MSVSSSSMSSDTNIGSATEVLDASASESSTSSVPIVVAWNFAASKYWTFRVPA